MNSRHVDEFKLFCGNSNRDLATEIAKLMGQELSKSEITTFSDGEISVSINETVRGRDVFVVQSTCDPVNNNLMELLIMIDALKRASAGKINAVIPYYGYARQDRKAKARDPITAKLVADLLSSAGADRVVTMDLHAPQIQGYFNIPVDHLMGIPVLVEYFKELNLKNLVIVSPDMGSVTRARNMAHRLDDIPIAIVDKRRPKANVAEVMHVIGEVKGKNIILVDDMIDTAGTITNSANALKELGAKKIFACATHGVLSGKAIEQIQKSAISQMILLNTVPLPKKKQIKKIKTLSVAPLFAEAMMRIFTNDSVSKLFDMKRD